MGCAPSIHVSQSAGVVYCRDENSQDPGDLLNPVGSHAIKPTSSASLSISEVVSHIPTGHRESLTTEVRITHIQGKRGSINSLIATTHQAWTVTGERQAQMEAIASRMEKVSRRELTLGPMKIYQHPMEILLVFGADDLQSAAFSAAASRGGYKCKQCYTTESAMDYYLKKLPEVVVIDLRLNISLDGEGLCRTMRSSRPNENTVILGVTKLQNAEQDEPSILPLLKAGFNRRFVENASVSACLNEILQLDYGEVGSQCKLRATTCLFSAVEHAFDAIEIQCVDSDRAEFQYVNPAYEMVTGYWRSEVVGSSKNSILTNCEVPKTDSPEGISKLLSKGKSWEGVCLARKKNGEQFVQSLKIVPIIGLAGKVTHHVVIKRDLSAVQKSAQIQQMYHELQKVHSLGTADKGMRDQNNAMQNVIGQSHSPNSLPSEAPITKVINMLSAVQENSPLNVVQVLEKVIDILRSTELYTPSSVDKVEEKGIETDLVEGLMWSNVHRRHSADGTIKGHLGHRDSGSGSALLPHIHRIGQTPEIQEALRGDDRWEYDVMRLEQVTNKKPLYYLGQTIFSRFNVGKFLNVSDAIIRNWLQLIEANYHSANAYHNSTHAADVLHATSVFLLREDVKNALEPIDEVSALIAAAVHDVDHPGFTNSFLCNAGNELAILYNDIAVLESHHAAMAFKLTTRDAKTNIFQNLESDDFKMVRQSIIDMIMATEMKQHFEHLSKFDNCVNKRHASHDDTGSQNGRVTPESTTSSQIASQTPENRAVIRRMIIKCADIANPARPTHLCYEWAWRIAEEYFRQTEEEKRRHLPIVMPVFDRNTCNVPKSQVFFIDYFVLNLFAAWDKFAHVNEAMEHLQKNYVYWKEEADKVEHERAAGVSSVDTAATSSSGSSGGGNKL